MNDDDGAGLNEPTVNHPELSDTPHGRTEGDRRESGTRRAPPTRTGSSIAGYRDRILDGRRVWGSFETTVGRYGYRSHRLVLFPPGLTTVERRLLRLWRALPGLGGMLCLMVIIWMSRVNASWVAIGIATALYVVIAAAVHGRLGPLRTQVRTVSAASLAGDVDPDAAVRQAEIKKLAAILCAADTLLAEERISLTEYESLWWQAYDRVGRLENR